MLSKTAIRALVLALVLSLAAGVTLAADEKGRARLR